MQLRIRGGTSEEAAAQLAHKGINVLPGEATFVSPHELTVAGKTISADRIIVAAGSQEVIPPIEGLNEAGFITNVEAVSLPTLPNRMAVVGGGAIGIEFAQMFHRFGVEVTVLERSSIILDKEDREVADTLCSLLEKEGLRLETSAELKRVQRDAQGKCLTIRCGERAEEQLVVDEILLAIGRQPSLASLHLEKAGVKMSKKGIEVDATLRSNVPHIWAAGDVTGGLQFTHVAYEQGKLAAHNAFAQESQPFDNRVIPWVTFSDPALAHVGKTEEQLRQEKVEYRATHMYFNDVERAIAEGATWRASLDRKPRGAPKFYAVMAISLMLGLALEAMGINSVKMLFWAAVANGVLAPPLIVVLVLATSNVKIMGNSVNPPVLRWLGWLTAALMALAAIAMFITLK